MTTWQVPQLVDIPEPESAPASTVREVGPLLVVEVRGVPGPQGSKSHKGGGRMVESSAKVRPWRDAVAWSAIQARQKQRGFQRLDGPLVVDMVFTLARPKGHYGTGRNSALLRPSAPLRPDVKPDLSKLIRATEDALTTAGVYRDDAQIVGYGQIGKWHATDHGRVPGVLDGPGCTIRLHRIERPGVGE